MKKTVERIVIDESVSISKMKRFEAFARKKGFWTSGQLYIRQEHPGMPDGQILHHLLNNTTIFVTTDRPFHNKVLSKGLRSYYIEEKKITGKPLPGIRIGPDVVLTKTDHVIKNSYHQPKTEIRHLLLPSSPSKLKKLHTKRRRIRSHFGGQDHLDQIAVTVSWKLTGSNTLIGIRIRASSNVGIKAFDASESYIAEETSPKHRSIAAVCHALILLIQLMLHPVKTLIYYDAANMDNPDEYAVDDSKDSFVVFFRVLAECFNDLEFVAAPKGPYVERLRKKLTDLAGNIKTNEIVPGNILEIMQPKSWNAPCYPG